MQRPQKCCFKVPLSYICKLTAALGDWVGGYVCWLLACHLEYCMAGWVLVVYQVDSHPSHRHLQQGTTDLNIQVPCAEIPKLSKILC